MPASPPHPFAVITGASRGIGAAYARALAAQGYDLLLVSRHDARLAQLAHEIESSALASDGLASSARIRIHVLAADLSQPQAAHQLFAESRRHREAPDMLINNAGFGLYGAFASQPLPRIQEMLRLHVQTFVETMRLFLPGMIERGSGVIINVASLAGLLPLPYCAEYAATKAFMVSFSEAVAVEVRAAGVLVQTCCPGPTATDFHDSAGFRPAGPLAVDTAARVVRTSLAAVRRRRSMVTIGWQGAVTAALTKWMPKAVLMRVAARRTRPPT